jgi:hypothetical protein
MAFIKLKQEDVFSEEAYKAFLESEAVASNARLRNAGVSFVDAMMSPEADFTKTENGEAIVNTIRGLPWFMLLFIAI